MTTIVVLNVNGTMIRVECDGLARDAVLSKNVVLTGCKELDTEARDGDARRRGHAAGRTLGCVL